MITVTLIYIIIAIVPGLAWLIYFLRKDNQREPGLEITKVFYFGMMTVIPVGLIEIGIDKEISFLNTYTLYYLLKQILVIALIEESFKYLIVRYLALKKSFLDEPIDIVIYMIVSGLGFATAENVLQFIEKYQTFSSALIESGIALAVVRFFGANLLHVLCSGIIGIFVALSFYNLKHRGWIIPIGFILSIVIHGVFNFSIELFIINNNELIAMVPFIITMTIFIPFVIAIKKVKKMKSVCKIN
jgi:RsiW-degrading membrane proteinase PrsW (M82 family)